MQTEPKRNETKKKENNIENKKGEYREVYKIYSLLHKEHKNKDNNNKKKRRRK